jgi:hypothetical protein
MAGNHSFVYAGTDLSEFAVSVNKSDFTVTQVGGANTTSITADRRGYVAVNSPLGNRTYDPHGEGVSVGGGMTDEVSARNAWLP